MKRIDPTEGMLYFMVEKIRPVLAKRIKETRTLETAVVGLGGQGTKHAELMREFGTIVTAGIAPGRGGTRVHEVIPVYDNISECLEDHPNIVAVSVWRHYSSARSATLEVIEAGIPVVVLITEGIPLRDMRDILGSARKYNTLLIGGNTPGIIFPPEGIKIGMLPDVFYPEEPTPGMAGPKGITIISRSGAILYHISDGLANAGVAQNAVLGVGGDGAIGSTFRRLVPLVMEYPHTDLVVVAGEIGGCQEELLAQEIKKNPKNFPKPLVVLISGACAPEGKTMGHAGAIVAPGQEYGTFQSKKKALEEAGVPVVNSQYDLTDVVRGKLKGRTYFSVERYFEKMRKIWEAPPAKPTWSTLITKVEPNRLTVQGYVLEELVRKVPLLAVAHLLVHGQLPTAEEVKELNRKAVNAAKLDMAELPPVEGEDLSKVLARYLLMDRTLALFQPSGRKPNVERTVFCLGRMARYMAAVQGNARWMSSGDISPDMPFCNLVYRAMAGAKGEDPKRTRILEAMIVASVDHGVTPPSAQATILSASTRGAYELSVAQGVGNITDVHGGAGAKAAEFFRECVHLAEKEGLEIRKATQRLIEDFMQEGKRIEGLGHRIHTKDPRRDVLWQLAEECNVAGPCVSISKIVSGVFERVRGIRLPINVDGVIGAIVADMGLPASLAKAIFIFGRVAGLSAHYFEEVASQPQMRRINFEEAEYRGPEAKTIPPGYLRADR